MIEDVTNDSLGLIRYILNVVECFCKFSLMGESQECKFQFAYFEAFLQTEVCTPDMTDPSF